MYATILHKGEEIMYKFNKERYGYIHVPNLFDGSVSVNDDVIMKNGDGVFIEKEDSVKIVGLAEKTELVFFDLK